jgi:titin
VTILTAVGTGRVALDSQAAPGITYIYQIAAISSLGQSAYSNQATATTLPAPPTAPVGLTAALANGHVALTWRGDPAGATQVVVWRKYGSGPGPMVSVGSVGMGVLACTDMTTRPGTTYTYEVVGANAGGTGAPSLPVTITDPLAPPAAPDTLNATVASTSQANLSWTDSHADFSGFVVFRQGPSGGLIQIAHTDASHLSYQDTTLVAGTSYVYQVLAVGATGLLSQPSPTASITTPNAVIQAPTSPAVLSATSAGVTLRWSAPANDHTGFLILRGAGSQAPTVYAVVGPGTTYTDVNVQSGVTYTYEIEAINGALASAPSAPAVASVP